MKKVVWLLWLVVTASCSKEENAAIAYEVLLDDNFTDTSTGWNTDPSFFFDQIVGTYTYNLEGNGRFEIRNEDEFDLYSDFKLLSLGNDFELRTSIFRGAVAQTNGGSGLLLNYADGDNYSFVAIDSKGDFDFGVVVEGKDTFKSEIDSLFYGETTIQDIKLTSTDGNVVCMVNGVEAVRFSTDTLIVDKVGLYADAGVNMDFSSIYAGKK